MSGSCFQPQRAEMKQSLNRQTKEKEQNVVYGTCARLGLNQSILLAGCIKSSDVTQGSHPLIHLHTQPALLCAKLLLKPSLHGYYCAGTAYTYDIIMRCPSESVCLREGRWYEQIQLHTELNLHNKQLHTGNQGRK